ncbi:MAG: response regulator [Desulfobulbus sp.]|nr:MAG: response regulator [Desulfobulbus sp.]
MGKDKILIVDDDVKLLGSLKTGLQKFGQFDIQTAVHGVQALAILKSTKAVILVTDLQMPRMDGVELLATVTREYPNMLCIVTTSLRDHALRKKFQGDSLFSYINKPFNHIRLHGEIIRMLDCRDEINFRPGIYIPAMLPLINMMQKSCLLEASAGLDKKGTFIFENGVISDVRTEQQAGVGALQEMLSWGPARYWIKPLPEVFSHETDNTLTAMMMQGTEVIPQDGDDDD